MLFHVTRRSNVESILKNGLVPKSRCRQQSHPERVYVITSIEFVEHITLSLRLSELREYLEKHKGEDVPDDITDYVLIKIDLELNERFLVDPEVEEGWSFYTEETIPKELLSVEEIKERADL